MEVTIGFARAHYEKLLHDVPAETPAYTILHGSVELDRWADGKPFSMCVIIECNRDEATALLQAAKQHCPEAVADIEYGIKLSRAFDVIS
jgi:hypothetical protein